MNEETEENSNEMGFLDHLEEFRWRLIYALIGIIIGSVVGFVFIDFVMEQIILRPAKVCNMQLQNLKPFGQLMIYFEAAMICGFVISVPNIFYQFWKFISPALKDKERKVALKIVFYSTISFMMGAVFAYYVLIPLSFKFVVSFGSATVQNIISIDEYLSILFTMVIGVALIFELPMLSYMLSSIGLLKPTFLTKYRRHAIVVIMILAAFITPGTDPVSQVVLAIPLLILYEISVFVSKVSYKKNITR